MSERLIFEAEPFETYSIFETNEEEQPDTATEFDTAEEEFGAEPTLLEWEEEARRGRTFGSRRAAPRLRTPPRRRPHRNQPRAPKRRPRPVTRRRRGPRIVVREPSIDDRPPEGTEYIRWVQSSLNSIMGLQLPVDGVMGVETRSAVRSFQRREGLPVDGMVGPETEQALIAARAGQSAAPSGDDADDVDTELAGFGWESEVDRSSRDYVLWVQRSLNRILGLRLAEDGLMGPQTRSAIRSFQRHAGLKVDGIVGPDTERALLEGSPKPPELTRPEAPPALTGPTYAVIPGQEYGPKWGSRLPPGLPAAARQASARGAALDAIGSAARRHGLGEVFVTVVSHLAQTESGATYARPADNIFDARPLAERPAGKPLITAWGVFQFNRDAWRSLPGTSPTSFPWDASAAEEIDRPVSRYAELFRQIRTAGGSELAAARGVRLWHRSPAAFRSYLRTGQSSGFDAAWQTVAQRHRAAVDERMQQIGLTGGDHYLEQSEFNDELWPLALGSEVGHSDEESSMMILSDSVGSSGANKQHDVFAIQNLLNKFILAGKLPGINNPLALDGKIGSKTISAIRAFQSGIVGMTSPDGRVDPGGLTLQALNGPIVQPPASPSPALPPPSSSTLRYGVPGGRISAKTHRFLGRRSGNRIHFGIDVSPSGAAGGGAGDPRRGLEVFFTPKAKIRISDLKSAPAAMKRDGPLENRIALDGIGDAWLQGATVTRAFTHKEPDNSYGGWVAIACQYGYVKSSGGSGVFTILIEYLHLITSDALPYPGQGNRISLSEWQKAGKGHRIGLGPHIKKGATFSASDALGSPPILIGFLGATRWPHVHIQAAFNPPGSTNFPRIDPAVVLT